MDNLEEEYEKKEEAKLEQARAVLIEEGSILAELITSQGWKIVKKLADAIRDPRRLKVAPDKIPDLSLQTITYMNGQIAGVDNLFMQIEARILQKDQMIKEAAENKETS